METDTAYLKGKRNLLGSHHVAHKLEGGRLFENHSGTAGSHQERLTAKEMPSGFHGKGEGSHHSCHHFCSVDVLTLCLCHSLGNVKWPSSGPMAPDANVQGPGRVVPSLAHGGISSQIGSCF